MSNYFIVEGDINSATCDFIIFLICYYHHQIYVPSSSEDFLFAK